MRVLTFVLCIIFLTACRGAYPGIPEEPQINHPVYPVYLAADTALVNLKDYFKQPEEISKIHLSEGLSMKWSKRQQLLRLTVTDSVLLFFNIRFRYEGYDYDVPVLCGDRLSDSLQVMTDQLSRDTIFLYSVRPVNHWEVYVDNYRLDKNSLIFSEQRLGILIPSEMAGLEYARLRVWASDESKLSGELEMSLRKGRVVTSAAGLDSLQSAAWDLKIRNYYHSSDLNREELVCLLETKIESSDNDTLLHLQVSNDSTVNPEVLNYADLLRHSMALTVGDYLPLRVEKYVFAYLRSYFGEEWIIVSNRRQEAVTLKLELPYKYRKTGFKSMFGNRFSYDNSRLIVDVPANGVEIIYN